MFLGNLSGAGRRGGLSALKGSTGVNQAKKGEREEHARRSASEVRGKHQHGVYRECKV